MLQPFGRVEEREMVKRVPPVNRGWPQTPFLFGIGEAAILFLLLFLFLATVKIVPAGNVGVVTSVGAFQRHTLDPGLHLVTPLVQNVYHFQSGGYLIGRSMLSKTREIPMVRRRSTPS
jgi:hypothetical protein